MKLYDETKPLYLETDKSGVALGAGLLQTRNGISCPGDTTPDNSILRPIAFIKIIFWNNGLPRKIMSDAGGNFISEKFEKFCKQLKIEHAVSYHPQGNGQVEVCIKLVKHTIKMPLILNQIYI